MPIILEGVKIAIVQLAKVKKKGIKNLLLQNSIHTPENINHYTLRKPQYG